MTPPTERRPVIDANSAPSAHSGVDETAAGASVAGTAVTGFGPPAAAGEVGTLGPYRVVKELGKGGMGAVYAAVDTRLDRRLALKVMLPQFAADTESRERFLREARAAARVKHDHVVTVYEADERNGVPYIAMEYLEGYPLDEYLKKKGNPTPAQVLKLAAETAAGLAAAHRQGLVHRDVKPGNLWLEAPAGRVKVLDFGLARPVDAEVELTKSGAVVGTPAYMSPEQARGEKVDHRTDLFSLGAVLYRLVTGRLPFQAPNTMAMLIALGTEDPPPVRERNPAVPEPLAELIHQLLAKSADARPASADEVVKRVRAMGSARSAPAAVQAASQVVYVPIQVTVVPDANPFADLDATEVEPIPAAAPAAVRRAPRRSWAVAAGLAAMMLAVFGGVIIIIRNRDGSETKIEVPDGATVTLKDKTGKTLAQVGPPKVAPVADDSPDRKAAKWVIGTGGAVRANGGVEGIQSAADLPKERFTLTAIDLAGNKSLTDAGLANLKGCHELKSLNLNGTAVTDTGLVNFIDMKGLTDLNLGVTRVTDDGLANFKACKNLTALDFGATAVTDVGLAHFKECKGLTRLSLGVTRITDAGLANFKECKGVTFIDLGRTGVTDEGLAIVKEWEGIAAVRLFDTKVTDAGLSHLKGCKGLKELDLQFTGVTDAGLASLENCKALATLNLNRARVTDAGLRHLRACQGLTFLDLRATKVTPKGLADFHAAVPGCRVEHDGGVIEAVDVDRKAAEWVFSVSGLVWVNGSGPNLKATAELPPTSFTLTHVNLIKTKVTDADLAKLVGCGGVVVLRLDGVGVTGGGLSHLTGLKSLRELSLSSSGVTDAALAHLKDYPALDDLELTGTPVTDAGLTHLAKCESLKHLGLGGTKVTGAGLGSLRGCKRLEILNLHGSHVTDAGLAHVKDCTELKGLIVTGTGVSDAGLAHLHECKRLTHLDVKRTKVTAAGLARFHAAVPGCRIEHDGGFIEPKK